MKGLIEENRFAHFPATVSLVFPVGKHEPAAVKVIDARGNEVMSSTGRKGIRGVDGEPAAKYPLTCGGCLP
ncbi:MAG: hypothetical protein NTW87_16805 [Planctomycetota bacterium]|nr:hypothetical protein [Planctomycetota bacterium]